MKRILIGSLKQFLHERPSFPSLIDGGRTLDGSFDPDERIVAPFLWKQKVKSIDYLVRTC